MEDDEDLFAAESSSEEEQYRNDQSSPGAEDTVNNDNIFDDEVNADNHGNESLSNVLKEGKDETENSDESLVDEEDLPGVNKEDGVFDAKAKDENDAESGEPINRALKLSKTAKFDENSKFKYLRLPKTIHISNTIFDERTYNEGEEAKEAELLQTKDKEIALDNMIRFRHKTDMMGDIVKDGFTGKPVLESNARFVTWSDGSIQMIIGQEVFDVVEIPFAKANVLYAATKDANTDTTVMVGEGLFTSEYKLRPHSMQSRTFKELEMKVKQKNIRQKKIKQTESIHDPTIMQELRAKANDDRLRAENRKSSVKKQPAMSFLESRNTVGYAYDEYESDENNKKHSVKEIKSRAREKRENPKRKDSFLSSSEEEAEEEEDSDLGSAAVSTGDEDDDEDELPGRNKKRSGGDSDDNSPVKKKGKLKTKAVMESSDEEDSD